MVEKERVKVQRKSEHWERLEATKVTYGPEETEKFLETEKLKKDQEILRLRAELKAQIAEKWRL